MYKTLMCNPALEGQFELSGDLVYSSASGVPVTLRVVSPWKCDANAALKLPLIVFVQGCGWTFPNVNFQLPQLCDYARRGYVIATVTHRSTADGHPFPAFLQDVKTAIRFMRAHAAEFRTDPDRVAVFGTSSGGNTALLVGLTGDDPRYKTAEYAEFSDSVKCVAECFGPTDLIKIAEDSDGTDGFMQFAATLTGKPANSQELFEAVREMSPNRIVRPGAAYPPFLLLHGDADPTVPYSQGELMYETLLANGCDASLIRVEGAPHEGSFWSRELHGEVLEFFGKYL